MLPPAIPSPQSMIDPLSASIVDNEFDLNALEAAWNELFAASPSASPPLRWNWVRHWWRIYGPIYGDGGKGLRILVLRRNNRVVGILPLYERTVGFGGCKIRRLSFVTHGAAEFEETCAANLDLLARAEDQASCQVSIARLLRSSPRLRWDELSLSNISQSSPLATLADVVFNPRQRVQIHDGDCYLFDMTGGFEKYVERLSKENRRQVRKLLREVETKGLVFDIASDAERAGEFFDQMVTLHRARWSSKGLSGSFAPRHAEFHRVVACQGAVSGDTLMARLCSGEIPLAVIYAHRVGQRVYCYQQGVDTTGDRVVRSPGTAAWLMLMKHTAEQGVTLFDHQTGKTEFKERYGTGVHPIFDLNVKKRNWRTTVHSAGAFTRRAGRRLLRMTSRLTSPRMMPTTNATRGPDAQATDTSAVTAPVPHHPRRSTPPATSNHA